MKVEVAVFSPEQWYQFAEEAHRAVFKTQRNPWIDRISFALMAVKNGSGFGYVTCRETDGESLYWQFGGCMDEFRGAAAVYGFKAFLEYSLDNYKRITTYVRNDNVSYLHLLMKMGFRCIGIRLHEFDVYLEMHIERPKDEGEIN